MRLKLPAVRPTRRSALAALGVVALVGSLTVASVAAADDVIITNDFESGSYAPWGPRGPVTLTITNEGHESANGLAVTGRTANWNGVATSATALFTPGVTYSVLAWAKLPAGTAGSTGIHFTVEATPAGGGANTHTWVGGNIATTADTWVQIGGDYTMPDDLSAATLYVEAEGADTPFLIDDVVIIAPDVEPEVVTVSAVDFEDGTTGTWFGSGSPTLTVVDDAGGKVLQVSNRVNSFDGPQSPAGIFQPGATHTFTARARLAPGGPASSQFRFVMKPAFTWIGNTTINADTWTTVSGEFTVPGDADPAPLQVYLEAAEATASYLVDDILITRPPSDPGQPEPGIVHTTGFETGLDGWGPRAGNSTTPTVTIATDQAHDGSQSARVSARDGQGDGIGLDVTSLTQPGVIYNLTAWVRFAPGAVTDPIWLSLAATTATGTNFSTLGQFNTVTNSGWTEVRASFTMPGADSALLYFETSFNGTNTSDFYVDDIVLEIPPPPVVEDLPGIHTTTDFPVGVAIDSRETVGPAAELLTRHFNQVTAENHMKVENWYDAAGNFRRHDQATAIMDFAQDNDLKVYGHVLLWHSQTPAWFFQDGSGNPLTTSAEHQQLLRDRLRTHIFNIAQNLSTDYGLFGSATNPLYAWDVVNEVVSDSGEFADGLRRSEWYRILGESYIDLAFQYADEAFNDQYAVAGQDPVTLFINDYNTEQGGKQGRYKALVQRLLARGVPIDGVGHQFHVSLAMAVPNLDGALDAFADLPVVQAVTEMDVTTGTPVTQASLIEQGYYFRDAFRVFREHAEDLFAVTMWGLTDNRSWRAAAGAPLIFDGNLKAKPAYYGAVDGDLPARLRTANVFAGDVPLSAQATSSLEWRKLPLHAIEDVAKFQLRWAPDHLTAYV
jgi:endo-1,4-beta-xylanase